MVALLLLALWMPATTHCKLEVLPGLDFLACSESDHPIPHQDSGCEKDACASVESGDYRIDYNPPLNLLPPSVLMPVTLDLLAAEPLPSDQYLTASHLSPPEMLKPWQFCMRAALPVRAPSIAS